MFNKELTPRQIVEELNKYIVGQQEAKKSVAIALRNRYRRQKLPLYLQDEVTPKNIIMIGPTGVGKTEIARRLAKFVKAPFVKIEATKFTEVGYVGRDVEAMIRDLVETSIHIVKKEKIADIEGKAEERAQKKIIDLLVPFPQQKRDSVPPFNLFFQSSVQEEDKKEINSNQEKNYKVYNERKEIYRHLEDGLMEDEMVEIEVKDRTPPMAEIFSNYGMEEIGINFQDLFENFMPQKKKKRRVPIKQARKILKQEEAEKLIDMDEIINEAIERAEQSGIIFLDEIDKIVGKDFQGGPDVSREGVQRDILPLVEGATVTTKYGPVKTDHILFIAAGAFHITKPSDLIPELQGRFPIRVELKSLQEDDLKKILTEPRNALIKQYSALLKAEGVKITFSVDAIEEIARTACLLNEEMENIGARRLYTIIEKLLEELSFTAPELNGQEINIDKNFVKHNLTGIIKDKNLSKYIL